MEIDKYNNLLIKIVRFLNNDRNLNIQRDEFLKIIIENNLERENNVELNHSIYKDMLLKEIQSYFKREYINRIPEFIWARSHDYKTFNKREESEFLPELHQLLEIGKVKYSGLKLSNFFLDEESALEYVDQFFYPTNNINLVLNTKSYLPLWEFTEPSLNFNTNLKNYYYVPVNIEYIRYADSLLFDYIPRRTIWKFDKTLLSMEIIYDFPLNNNLIPLNTNYFIRRKTIVTTDIGHNFFPNFIFTGVVYFIGEQGVPYYEYSNLNNDYSFPTDIYISKYKPVDLDFPIGLPREDELEECLLENVGDFPENGDIERDIGEYTGYITNSKYHNKITYYLYRRSDDTIFLSDHRPNKMAKDFVFDKRLDLYDIRDPFQDDYSLVENIEDINILSSDISCIFSIEIKDTLKRI
ncbi:hypothetical protein V6O07_23960 [Arthrospira platensis SPKY2]